MDEKIVYISIAGFILRVVFEETSEALYPKKQLIEDILYTYSHFLLNKSPKKYDYEIIIQEKIPFLTHESEDSTSFFMSLYSRSGQSKVTAWYYISSVQFCFIIKFVIDELLVKNGGFTLHASGVKDSDGVSLFMGPSGAGKSTISTLLSKKFPIFCDDSVLVKPENGTYYLYQNPNEKKPVEYVTNQRQKLQSTFLIKKSHDNNIAPLTDLSEITELFLKQFKFSKYDEKKQLSNLFTFLHTHPKLFIFDFSLDQREVTKTFQKKIEDQ